MDSPPVWILDLSIETSVDQAASLLGLAWVASEATAGGQLEAEVGSRSCWLGFLYLRFERGELGMAELLERAGREADVRDFGLDCSAFYLLLNEIDGGGPTIPSDRPLEERVRELFEPFVAAARAGVRRLPAKPA